MRSSAEIRRELREAEAREHRAKIQCVGCDGKGWYSDTTYDRTGQNTRCYRCHGTGLPKDLVDMIIEEAFAPHRKPIP